MADLQAALQAHREAIEAFLAAARAVPAERWDQPRASGKWSPAQVVEHVTLAYETGRRVLYGDVPSRGLPRIFRPLVRRLLINPVLRTGRFMSGSRSPKIFQPSGSPAAVGLLLDRFQAATSGFAKDAAGRPPTLEHPYFGRLSVADFVRFQAIHARHHQAQLTP